MPRRLFGAERDAHIRRRLLLRIEEVRRAFRTMPADAQRRYDPQIKAWLVAADQFEQNAPGASYPPTPAFVPSKIKRSTAWR